MLNIKVSESDWSIVKEYWDDLQKRFQPDDLKKVDFLNRVVFESSSSCENESDTSSGSVRTRIKVSETKVEDSQTVEMNIDEIDEKITTLVNCQQSHCHTYTYTQLGSINYHRL